MSYSTSTDITNEFKSIDFTNVNSKVTTSEVEEFIVQEDAFIDAIISKVYVVPVVSDATSLSLLKKISILLVVDRVKKIINHLKPIDKDKSFSYTERKQALEMLNKIVGGEIKLNSPERNSLFQTQSHINDDPSIMPYFKKEVRQW